MILAHLSRITNDSIRGLLITFWFPVEMARWLWTVLRNDPKQLFTVRPYSIARTMFLIGVDGFWVGADIEREQS
jgi:hypothetical protein